VPARSTLIFLYISIQLEDYESVLLIRIRSLLLDPDPEFSPADLDPDPGLIINSTLKLAYKNLLLTILS
jgi:hypothetical protein